MFETSAHPSKTTKANRARNSVRTAWGNLAKFSRWAVLVAIWLFLLWLGFFSVKYHHSAIAGLYIFVAASAVLIFIEQVWNQ